MELEIRYRISVCLWMGHRWVIVNTELKEKFHVYFYNTATPFQAQLFSG